MNLKRIVLAVAVTAGASLPLCAEEVTGDDAMSAVAGWVNVKAALGEDFTAQPSSVREYPAKDGNGKFYVVELEGGGFVVTSGDTGLEPVIAYSKDGTWIDDVKQNPLLAMLPIDVAAMMAELSSTNSAELCSANSTSIAGGRRLAATASEQQQGAKAAKWAGYIEAATATSGGRRLSAGRITANPGDLRVGKLLTTTWSQGSPNSTRVAYNYYTPTKAASSNYRLYCGCVATAGGQIMHYHKWPQSSVTLLKNYTQTFENGRMYNATDGYQTEKGGAYTAWDTPFGGTYDWTGMTSNNSTTKNQSIGKLLRDIGISVYMNYTSSGSGAAYSCLYLRLTDQFGYANAAFKYNITDDDWRRGILASLDAKLPVAVEVPGHAIVADGYGYQGDALYIHFNMGWGGSSDAWYNPPDLTEAGSAYNSFNCIIYNIYPEGTPNCTIVSGRLKNASGSLMTGVTVTAVDRASGGTFTATTDDKGIYAFKLPAGSYGIGTSDGSGHAAATNLSVAACESTALARGTMEQEASGAFYVGTGKVADIPGVELQLAAVAVPTIYPADGTTFYGASRTVKIACIDSAAEVRYTLDGSEPTTASALYEGPFTVSATTTVKAKAFVGGEWGGVTASATLTKGAYYGAGGLYPDNKASRAAHWLDERAAMQEATGAWSNAVEYVDGKVTLAEGNEFTTTTPAKGAKTTIYAKVSFDTWGAETDTDFGDVKAGVRIGTNGCFQAYAFADGAKKWLNLTGVTPVAGTDYTVKLVLSNSSMTYTASIVDGSAEIPLSSGGQTRFGFANQSRARIEKVLFNGEGKVESLTGSYSLNKGVIIAVE